MAQRNSSSEKIYASHTQKKKILGISYHVVSIEGITLNNNYEIALSRRSIASRRSMDSFKY